MDKITLNYFMLGDSVTRGRGENVKLMLEDAGLEHDYIRYKIDQSWYDLKEKLMKEGHHSCTLPFIQTNGQYFFKTDSILPYISAKLGYMYHGSTPEENQLVSVVAEVSNLWFDSLRKSYWGSDEQKRIHLTETPLHVALFEKFYSDHEGPYLLGNKITFADFKVYHMIDDDSARHLLCDAPNLAKFVEAFEQRPNIRKYLATLPPKQPSN